MSALDSLADKHPATTGATGIGTTLVGWLLSNIESINAVLRCVSLILTVLIGLMTLVLMLRRARRDRYYLRGMTARELADEDDIRYDDR